MRIFEILQEGYNQSLSSDLNNLLVSAIAVGAQEIKTIDLIKKLQSMGYSVDTNSLLPLLSNNAAVANATPGIVRFREGPPTSSDQTTQDSAEKVKNLAAKATKIG